MGGGSFACACAAGSGGPRCAAAVCPALSFDAEGGTVVISNGGTYPSTTTYVCEGGAPPLGTTTRECRPDGSWSEGEPGACPTCDDGAQNGDEMGADCGGATCAACHLASSSRRPSWTLAMGLNSTRRSSSFAR